MIEVKPRYKEGDIISSQHPIINNGVIVNIAASTKNILYEVVLEDGSRKAVLERLIDDEYNRNAQSEREQRKIDEAEYDLMAEEIEQKMFVAMKGLKLRRPKHSIDQLTNIFKIYKYIVQNIRFEGINPQEYECDVHDFVKNVHRSLYELVGDEYSYAYLFKCLLSRLRIKTHLVIYKQNELLGMANLVKLDDHWYFFDPALENRISDECLFKCVCKGSNSFFLDKEFVGIDDLNNQVVHELPKNIYPLDVDQRFIESMTENIPNYRSGMKVGW